MGIKSWGAVWRLAHGHFAVFPPKWWCDYLGNCAVPGCLSGHFWFGYGPGHFGGERREDGRAEQPNMVTAVAFHRQEGLIRLGLACLGSALGCSWRSTCLLKLTAAVFRGTWGQADPWGIPLRNSLRLSSSFCYRLISEINFIFIGSAFFCEGFG